MRVLSKYSCVSRVGIKVSHVGINIEYRSHDPVEKLERNSDETDIAIRDYYQMTSGVTKVSESFLSNILYLIQKVILTV